MNNNIFTNLDQESIQKIEFIQSLIIKQKIYINDKKININYNKNNVFYNIVNNNNNQDTIFLASNEYAVAFKTINPLAPKHFLIIPRKNYSNDFDFRANASIEEKLGIDEIILQLIKKFDIYDKGYKLEVHTGKYGQQEVFHYHIHLLSQ